MALLLTCWTLHNKCTFSAKQYLGIYFCFSSITFLFQISNFQFLIFLFVIQILIFFFFNLITIFLKGILPVNFSFVNFKFPSVEILNTD